MMSVGILLQISHKFFKKQLKPLGFEIGEERDYGIGMFSSRMSFKRNRAQEKMFEVIIEKKDLSFLDGEKFRLNPCILQP